MYKARANNRGAGRGLVKLLLLQRLQPAAMKFAGESFAQKFRLVSFPIARVPDARYDTKLPSNFSPVARSRVRSRRISPILRECSVDSDSDGKTRQCGSNKAGRKPCSVLLLRALRALNRKMEKRQEKKHGNPTSASRVGLELAWDRTKVKEHFNAQIVLSTRFSARGQLLSSCYSFGSPFLFPGHTSGRLTRRFFNS